MYHFVFKVEDDDNTPLTSERKEIRVVRTIMLLFNIKNKN